MSRSWIILGFALSLLGCSSSDELKKKEESAKLRDLTPAYVDWWLSNQPVPDSVLEDAGRHFEKIPSRGSLRRNSFLVAYAQGFLDALLDPDRTDPGRRRGYFAGRHASLAMHPLGETELRDWLKGFGYEWTEVQGYYESGVGVSRFLPTTPKGEAWWLDSLPQVEDRSQSWRGGRLLLVKGYLSPRSAEPRKGYVRELIAKEIVPAP